MKSFRTFGIINTIIFLYFQKVLTLKLWQNIQFTTAILLLYSPPRAVNIKQLFFEIEVNKNRSFKNRSLQNFQPWQFMSLSLRKQQRNGLNETVKSFNCFFT